MSPRTTKAHGARVKRKTKQTRRQLLDESPDAVERLRAQLDVAPQTKLRADRVLDDIAEHAATLKMLRKVHDLTQVDIALATGMSQAEISRIEQRSDVLLSTLRKVVEATGGELQLVVRYPDVAPVSLAVDI